MPEDGTTREMTVSLQHALAMVLLMGGRGALGIVQPCASDTECRYPQCEYMSGPSSDPWAVKCDWKTVNVKYFAGYSEYNTLRVCMLAITPIACDMRNCAAGEYRAVSVSSLYNPCQRCDKGTYSPSPEPPGVVLLLNIGYPPYRCLECGVHEYQNATGQAACIPCESGTYQFSTGQSACLRCPATACPPGQYLHSSVCREACRPCSACPPGQVTVRPCSNTSDTVCGSPGACQGPNVSALAAYDWITPGETCRKGEYLWGLGPPPGYTKVCVRCPAGLAGLNGVYCEACGPLRQPYYLDQASCVCAGSAVMNASGGCVCQDGYAQSGESCVECGRNSYGVGGACYACPPGTVAGPGATSCAACAAGKYRMAGQAECTDCGAGWFAPDTTGARGCARCNTSCPAGARTQPCPGSSNDSSHVVCAACDEPLPGNASWTSGCDYDCRPGFYRVAGGCKACSVDKACPAGFRASECGPDSDANCDTACVNASKPDFYSEWRVSRDCQWGCQRGYSLAVTDYWVFKVLECVPGVGR